MRSAAAPWRSASRALIPRNERPYRATAIFPRTVTPNESSVACSAVAVDGWHFRKRRRRVDRDRPFGQLQLAWLRRHSPDTNARRVRHPHVIRTDACLESPRSHTVDDIVASTSLSRSARHVRLARECACVLTRVRGRRERHGIRFESALRVGVCGRVAGQRRRRLDPECRDA
jgi:hypothetical protein